MNHRLTIIVLVSLAALLPLATGCGESNNAASSSTAVKAAVPKAYFTRNRPEEVVDLVDVKTTAAVGDEVTFLARVGGRMEPFVEGVAIFTVADPSLESCELMGEEDHCPLPWDYCCEDPVKLTAGSATIRIVDESGRPLPASAQGAGGLAPARYLVVGGVVADRNDDGLFVVDVRDAGRIWVGGRPDRTDHRKGSRSGEESINVPVHDHDFDGIPDHDHDHHDHDHDHHDHDHDHDHDHADHDHGAAPASGS